MIVSTPGRICLFGEHQDYLGLPVIACSIGRFINLKAATNKYQKLYIKLPDINSERIIEVSEKFENLEKGDIISCSNSGRFTSNITDLYINSS